ncbi:transporter [Paenibacillus sp. MMO-58]|uniref:transporter n=1 Tax=Paenibacillus sp. MMO-58 TaxID=3081290 RepID=UPI0030168D15
MTTRQFLQAPPPYVPPKPPVSYVIDCINNYTYVWLRDGQQFWYYPTSVESFGISGFRWNGYTWLYYGIDPRLVEAVSCPPIPTLF